MGLDSRSEGALLKSSHAYLIASILGWCLVGMIVYGSLSASPLTQNVNLNDKSQHFLAYFVTMAWFAQVYGNSKGLIFQGTFLATLAVGLEFAQLTVGKRVYEPVDIVAGICGVIAGAVVPGTLLDRFLRFTGVIDGALGKKKYSGHH